MSSQTFDNSLTTIGMTSTTLALRSTPEVRAKAVRAVCGLAKDATEASEVLEALGLDPAEGKTQP